jgi:hypothetical protein
MKVTGYEFGKIEIDGASYDRDVILTPEEIIAGWWRREGHRLSIEDLPAIVAARPDVLVVGTGYYGRMTIPEDTQRYLAGQEIELRHAPTREAVQEFLRLQRNYARVVGAFHLTC